MISSFIQDTAICLNTFDNIFVYNQITTSLTIDLVFSKNFISFIVTQT